MSSCRYGRPRPWTALGGLLLLCYLPRLYVNRTDMYAILFLGWVTAGRFLWPGLASAVRYDELLQAAMLYAALRDHLYGRAADNDTPAHAFMRTGHL